MPLTHSGESVKERGMSKNYCIIMAGGLGSRFWPISRNSKPKQFLDMLGTGKTFIQQTFDRFAQVVPIENILVVTSESYRELVEEQLPLLKKENLLLEPYRRNTAPCIAYATYKLQKKEPNATLIVTPSDHLITNDSLFFETVKNGLDYASKNDYLITLGMTPNRAETAYGYIQAKKSSHLSINGNIAYHIKTFTEKPPAELAEIFYNSGEFLWNSGIFIWNLQTIKGELERHQSEMASLFKGGEPHYYTDGEQQFINELYQECQNISIDYGVMEKTDKAIVYPASFGWTDLGSWDSFYNYCEKEADGNYLEVERSLLKGVTNSIIISKERGKTIIASGLENFMVIELEDLLLISPREPSAYKALLAEMALRGLGNFL